MENNVCLWQWPTTCLVFNLVSYRNKQKQGAHHCMFPKHDGSDQCKYWHFIKPLSCSNTLFLFDFCPSLIPNSDDDFCSQKQFRGAFTSTMSSSHSQTKCFLDSGKLLSRRAHLNSSCQSWTFTRLQVWDHRPCDRTRLRAGQEIKAHNAMCGKQETMQHVYCCTGEKQVGSSAKYENEYGKQNTKQLSISQKVGLQLSFIID